MKSLPLLLALVLSTPLLADDTPFLNFHCVYERTTEDYEFDLKFKNDESDETETWSSGLKRTKMRFEKKNKGLVNVWISTGIPIISYGIPEVFEFSAPLNQSEFNFSFGTRPLGAKGEFFSLTCKKRQ